MSMFTSSCPTNLPKPTTMCSYQHTTVVYDQTVLIVFGGATLTGIADVVESYDVTKPELGWVKRKSMPSPGW